MAISATTQGNTVPDCSSKVQSPQVHHQLNMSNHSRGSVATTSHRTRSSSKATTTSSADNDVIQIEPLNDLVGFLGRSSENNRDSICSIGESSLSSFLSILLEDELPYEIVPDNPKPEQRSIRDLRLSFMASAIENDKPKCRWDYLTRDNSDRDLMRKRKLRNKMEIRSVSFSGAINSHTNSKSTTKNKNKQGGNSNSSGNAGSMFLRMPQRQRSPTDDETAAKKSLSKRLNMSDSDLMRLPMPTRRGNDNNNNPATGRERGGLSRSGGHETSTGNASWSKSDVRERRRVSSNLFLDIMIEPDNGGKGVGATSPLTPSMSSLESSSSSSTFQMSQQQQDSDLELSALSGSSKRLPKMPCPSRSPRSPRKTKSLPTIN